MSTVGYGDISPSKYNFTCYMNKTYNKFLVSSYERIYGIIVTIMSCGIFGYAISTIQNIFAEKSRKQATFKYIQFKLSI